MPSYNDSLLTIANAIAKQEGYGAAATNRPTRNNNPGDIKQTSNGSNNPNHYPTDDQGHIIYPTVDLGMAALTAQLNAALTPGSNSHFNPNMTLAEFGKKYATDPNWATGVAKNIDQGAGVITTNTKMGDISNYIQTGAVPSKTAVANPAANGAPAYISDTLVERTPSDYVDLHLPQDEALNTVYQDLNPQLVIKEGLDVQPWFDDLSLVTGNPRIRRFVTPVSFRIILKELNGGGVLSVPDGRPHAGEPIEIRLNASLSTYRKTSKHIYSKTNTRTGFHISFWGMQADVIEAEGSTGVFMNQMGITDFMSTSIQNDELTALLAKGFAHVVDANTGDVEIANAAIQKNTNTSDSSFRVAAQDAFVELLSLFKNNGNVYFRRDNYTGQLGDNDQAGVSAWSSQTGLSSQQGNSRNNDVMTRGYIAMQLKNNTYLGYFKNLSWTMDANAPFQWKFSFSFQVERTISLLEYPRLV